ncbi:Nn.00g100490.m01.CDS01 [Neocucurbitaria sp. VM-36]
MVASSAPTVCPWHCHRNLRASSKRSKHGNPAHPTTHLAIPDLQPRPSKDSTRLGTLQQLFDAAVLAEAPTESYLIHENKYPSIRALRTDADIGDGLWICCHCRNENILRHYKGPFPFQYLRCNRCNRVLCSECHTSEILSTVPFGMICASQPAGYRELRYCHVCSTCGLSHRAETSEYATLDFYGVTCAGCGTSSYGDWPRYHIGNNEPYRRDPDATFARLVDQKADNAAIANPESDFLTSQPALSGSSTE